MNMTDGGLCTGGQMGIAMPYTGVRANAAAVWGIENDVANAQGVYYNARADDVAFRSYGNLGGLNPDVNPQPFYDPRTVTMKAPVETSPWGLVTPPSLRFGTELWQYGEADVQPRTQYAAQGDLLAEPIVVDVVPAGQPCVCPCVLSYSMTSLLMTPRNILALRSALMQAGLIAVTPALLALDPSASCGCALLGASAVYAGFATFAQQYTDVSIIQILEPARQAAYINQVYVSRFIATAKAAVTAQGQMNYTRAEGPRAQLQAYPRPDCSPSGLSAGLPEFLPGTGVPVVETDTLFATRALTDPRSAVSNKAALSCLTGLRIGADPRLTPDFLDPRLTPDFLDPRLASVPVQSCVENKQSETAAYNIPMFHILTPPLPFQL